MNTQPMNMAGMPGAGGPVGGTPLVNSGSRSGMNQSRARLEQLNTYIYDYFIRNELWDVARAMHRASKAGDVAMPLSLGDGKPSPSGRDVNGVGDAMDTDGKDSKRPQDIPEPGNKIGLADNCFLTDWWIQFWDMFDGQRGRVSGGAISQYIGATQNQQRLRQEQQNRLLQNAGDPRAMYMNRMAQPNGMTQDLQKAAILNRGNMNPAVLAQNRALMQQKLNAQRDGANMNMGDQRPQSPGNGDNNAPSPKRPRIDGNFNGQMNPAGRGQTMPGQPGMQGPNAPPMLLQNGLNPEAMAISQQKQLEAMGAGTQGSPMGQPNTDGGNHALQDYQMQLMLLEQQNKKRLLMARQEQDSMGGHPTGSGPMPPQGFAAPAMSPSGSRAGGPSPNPAEMAKRGTPKMGPGTIPGSGSPADPNMQGNRGSPAPNFDPNQLGQGSMNAFYPMGVQGANMMGRPPSSHPGAQGMPMNAQQIAEFQRAGAAGRMPNGQMFPGMMQNAQQPGQPGQQPGQQQQISTPRQTTTMGPPPAPQAGGEQGRTNPSSPAQQNAQPPTPSQSTKNLPKKAGKKNEPAKKANAKAKNQGNTGATPASEAEPPTPTPSTPITPMHASSFGGQKNGAQPAAGAGVPGAQQAAAAQAAAGPAGGMEGSAAPFGDLGENNFGSLDLASFETGDVLDNFDFDSFLHTEDQSAFGFGDMGFPTDGVEAGGDVA